MGLASALSTALTGLNAAETSIDVAGNNISNANTVGFKESSVTFANQFLQTLSLGSEPTTTSGGTNPSQSGLGVEVVETSPDFSQGTIQNSSNSNDLAIQGDGFFVVQGNNGQQYFTRDGEFTTNANNQLVNSSGDLVLGQTVNSDFQIESTQLSAITLPLGSTSTAEATTEATLEGALPPATASTAAAQGSIIASQALSDGAVEVPTNMNSGDLSAVTAPDVTGTTAAAGTATPGNLTSGGTYEYEVTYSYTDSHGNVIETQPSSPIGVSTTGAGESVTLTGLAPPPTSAYTSINIYRTDSSGSGNLYEVGSVSSSTTSFTDTMSDASLTSQPELNTDTLNAGSYSYYVTYYDSATGVESQPTSLVGPITVGAGGAIELNNLPVPSDPNFNQIRLYRDTAANSSTFYQVATLAAGTTTYIDKTPDADITSNPTINLNGPAINSATLLTNVVEYSDGLYTHPFAIGTLAFTGTVGSNTLTTKNFAITSSTTVGDFAQFLSQSFGVQTSANDPSAGFTITSNGQIQLTGDGGTANALDITTSSISEKLTDGTTQAVNLNFSTNQAAAGQSVSTNFVAYDSLGTAVNVTISATLESTTSSGTTYRWYATSGDNEPTTGSNIAVGTGTITFDGNGNLSGTTNTTVAIDRNNGATSPLQFNLDFSQVSGLSNTSPSLDVSTQNGTAPGTLSSYSIGQSGLITGSFSNGVTQTLGQIMLAKFANNDGLVQEGSNLYSAGVNSGLPIIGVPETQGIGSVISGAVEESNTDVGQNLINLITASTTYQGGAQVISTVQQLYATLLNLRTTA